MQTGIISIANTMSFDTLHSDTDCDCLQDTTQDFVNLYVRKIEKPILKEKDLRTHWERAKRPDVYECINVCSYKGMSVNIWNESSQTSTLNKFLTTFKFAPSNRKDSMYVFRFKEDAGLLKHTPDEGDLFHYDFYKCDGFSENMLESVEIISLREALNNQEQN